MRRPRLVVREPLHVMGASLHVIREPLHVMH
jgi:hypothetical protein